MKPILGLLLQFLLELQKGFAVGLKLQILFGLHPLQAGPLLSPPHALSLKLDGFLLEPLESIIQLPTGAPT